MLGEGQLSPADLVPITLIMKPLALLRFTEEYALLRPVAKSVSQVFPRKTEAEPWR